jgi:hypothetical protein
MQRKEGRRKKVSGYCCVLLCYAVPFIFFYNAWAIKGKVHNSDFNLCGILFQKKILALLSLLCLEFFSTQIFLFLLAILFLFVYLKSANLYAASQVLNNIFFFICAEKNNCACSLMSCKKLRKPSIKFYFSFLLLFEKRKNCGPAKKYFLLDSSRDTKGKTQSICRREEQQFIRQRNWTWENFSKWFHLFFY